MALIDHIRRCNRWTAANFIPFQIGGHAVGRIRPEMAERLRAFPDLFTHHDQGVALSERWTTPEARSDAFRHAAEKLAAGHLRGEDYRVVADWGAPPLMVMDRALVPAFGIRAFGIHVNGVVRRPDGLWLWIGKRAADKSVEPGKLDNMVAGGQPAGLSLEANLIKESAEEAGLSEEIARQARPAGAITYCMEEGAGLKRDTLFVYDLLLTDDIIPHAVDGEMEGFSLLPLPDLLDRLRRGFTFKFNVALVLIDFMIRHGFIGPENEPDYLALATGLHKVID